MTHILRKNSGTANVKKSLKSVSVEADFLYDENIDHTEKKAQNSNFDPGRLHGDLSKTQGIRK